jgi:hypothetical protein
MVSKVQTLHASKTISEYLLEKMDDIAERAILTDYEIHLKEFLYDEYNKYKTIELELRVKNFNGEVV